MQSLFEKSRFLHADHYIYNTFDLNGSQKLAFQELKKNSLRVETPSGVGTLDRIYVTELGHLMAKIYFPSKKCWVNYKLCDLPSLLGETDLKIFGFG